MTHSAKYTTLWDYVRVVRANWLLIVICAAVFAAAGYVVSARQAPTYAGEATVSFRQSLADSELIGVRPGSGGPDQSPFVNAALVSETRLLERVKRRLNLKRSMAGLRSAITGRVEEDTGLLVIEGRARTAALAAGLTNEVADQVVGEVNRDARRSYAAAARALEREFAKLPRPDASTRAVTQERLARLQALRDLARPAELVKESAAPTGPISPKPLRNALLGLLLGAALGMLVAFLRDSLDRKLRDTGEIQERMDLPLLGALHDDALGRPPFGRNGHEPLQREAIEAFRILRANLHYLPAEDKPRIIAITSGLPREGKSTVAAALAAVEAGAGRATLLVECDLRRPSLSERFGLRPEPGLTDYLMGQVHPSEILQGIDVGEGFGPGGNGASTPRARLVCVTAGSSVPFPAELLDSTRLRETLPQLSEVYDTVILDTPPLLAVADTRSLLPLADRILVCVRASQTTRDEAAAVKNALGQLPLRTTALVVTGLARGHHDAYGSYAYAYGYE